MHAGPDLNMDRVSQDKRVKQLLTIDIGMSANVAALAPRTMGICINHMILLSAELEGTQRQKPDTFAKKWGFWLMMVHVGLCQ